MQIQTINKLKELTDNRKQLFTEYLTITQKLTDLKEEDVEQITAGMEQRAALAGQIDDLGIQSRKVCRADGREEHLTEILQCRADFSLLSEEEKELFSLCQSVNRILLEIRRSWCTGILRTSGINSRNPYTGTIPGRNLRVI